MTFDAARDAHDIAIAEYDAAFTEAAINFQAAQNDHGRAKDTAQALTLSFACPLAAGSAHGPLFDTQTTLFDHSQEEN